MMISLNTRNDMAFKRAQSAYDNMSPPDNDQYDGLQDAVIEHASQNVFLSDLVRRNPSIKEKINNLVYNFVSQNDYTDKNRYWEADEDGKVFLIDTAVDDIVDYIKDYISDDPELMMKIGINVNEHMINSKYETYNLLRENGSKIMKDIEETKGTKGSTANKIKKLHKQYNKILVDLFDQFAAESIESALDDSEGSFGENIQEIVTAALEILKGKVMVELGIKGAGEDVSIGGVSIAVGNMDLANGMDMNNMHIDDEDDNEIDDTDEITDKEDEDEVEVKEKYNRGDGRFISRDRIISESRRRDQLSISEAYMSMHKR